MTTAERIERYIPRGVLRELPWLREPEIVIEGPANTGKTFGICHFLHRICLDNPGARVLMVRKTLVSLTDTALVTLREKVLTDADPCTWFGGSRFEPASLRYDNGSRIVVGGMDNASKFLSGEYDAIYANEMWELSLEDYETLLTRLRNGVLARPRFIGDTNPTYAHHWMYQRPSIKWLTGVFADNPTVSESYLDTLRSMTGTRYQRFYLGQRVGMEDAIYPAFDRSLHVRPLEPGLRLETVLGVDYGRAHLSAVVALSRDQYGRRWVREAWAEVDQDGGKSIMRTIGAMRQQYTVARGRVDPNQGFLGGQAGFNIAKGSAGSRMHRIDLMEPLFYSYPGGRVPTLGQEFNQALPHGPYAEPDSPGILFVEGAPGIEELCSEIEAYHYVWTETPKGKTKDVYRVDENRIAALEYAAEELSEGADYTSLLTARAALLRR